VADGVSVVSAAVVSGELILGLSSGQLIRAGFVQGVQGLQGPQGPKGDTGRPGADGNTLLHGPGSPLIDEGNAGDFYIDTTRSWLYGPKTNSNGWGSPVKLKPDAATMTLPTGFKAQTGDAIYPRVFAGAMAGGGGGGTVMVGGNAGTGTGAPILIHGQPLAAGAPTVGPPPTAAKWAALAVDPDGHAMIVDIYAESADGSILVQVGALMDSKGNTGFSTVYEVRTGVPPQLSFQADRDNNGKLRLSMHSSVALGLVEGRVLYV
jgi:hypothetical protein